MQGPDYQSFFRGATGHPPFPYQGRLAGADSKCKCESRLIDIPTGLGKTAAVVLSWLWNRVAHPEASHRATWPRRLVYCLPMRTLVEQIDLNIREWLAKLSLAGALPGLVLMGGAEKEDLG